MSRLTVPEAARRAGRHPETVRRWIRQGKLRSERIGTRHLIREEDLDAILPEPPLDLPPAWTTPDEGPMPPWESLVRSGRDSH